MEGYNLFQNLLENIDQNITTFLMRAEIKQNTVPQRRNQRMATNESKDKALKQTAKKKLTSFFMS